MKKQSAHRIKEESKKALFNALLQCMHEKKYNDITVSDICNASGFSRQTFYRHHVTKDEIVKNHFYFLMDGLYETISLIDNPTISDILTCYLQMWLDHRDFTQSLLKSECPYISLQMNLAFIKKSFAHIQYPKHIKKEDAELFLAGGLYCCLRKWVENYYNPPLPEILNNLILLFNAIFDSNAS